jgi:dihydrofolate reductase
VPAHDRSGDVRIGVWIPIVPEIFVLLRSRLRPLRSGFVGVDDLDRFLDQYSHDVVWVVGGAQLYALTIDGAQELLITQIDKSFQCKKFLPDYWGGFESVSVSDTRSENGIPYRFEVWRRASRKASHVPTRPRSSQAMLT